MSIQSHLEAFLLGEKISQRRIFKIIDHMKSEKGLKSMQGRWDMSIEEIHPACFHILCVGALSLNQCFEEEIMQNN